MDMKLEDFNYGLNGKGRELSGELELGITNYERVLYKCDRLSGFGLPLNGAFVNYLDIFKEVPLYLSDGVRVAVAGEGRSGKSTLINTLQEGAANYFSSVWADSDRCACKFLEFNDINVFGAPIANKYLESENVASELHLVVTSVERPLTALEVDYINTLIHVWGRNVVIIISKIDREQVNCVQSVEEYIATTIGQITNSAQKNPFSGSILGCYAVSYFMPETFTEVIKLIAHLQRPGFRDYVKYHSLERLTGILSSMYDHEYERLNFRIKCALNSFKDDFSRLGDSSALVSGEARIGVEDLSLFGKCLYELREWVDNTSCLQFVFGDRNQNNQSVLQTIDALSTQVENRLDELLRYRTICIGDEGGTNDQQDKSNHEEMLNYFATFRDEVLEASFNFRRAYLWLHVFFAMIGVGSLWLFFIVSSKEVISAVPTNTLIFGICLVMANISLYRILQEGIRSKLKRKFSSLIGNLQNTYMQRVDKVYHKEYEENVASDMVDKLAIISKYQDLLDKLRIIDVSHRDVGHGSITV